VSSRAETRLAPWAPPVSQLRLTELRNPG